MNFGQASVRDYHVKAVHEGFRRFICVKCGHGFDRRRLLEKHVSGNGRGLWLEWGAEEGFVRDCEGNGGGAGKA